MISYVCKRNITPDKFDAGISFCRSFKDLTLSNNYSIRTHE